MNKAFKIKSSLVLIFFFAYLILFLLTCKNGFFWDTTHLASLQAWWYYDNNFNFFFLPTSIDSGHPSFFGMFLALMWKIFGIKLVVSHLMMLPFLVLLIAEVVKTTTYYFEQNWFYVAALILFNPIILGQATLVSPDVVLFCFFFFTLNGILKENRVRILIGLLVLGGISMRGMMCVAYFYIFCILRGELTFRNIIRYFIIFLPGILVVILFLSFHYKHSGWIGYHINSPWAESFERVGLKGFGRNIIVFFWRMVDMGMIFIWAIMGFAVLPHIIRKAYLSHRTKELVLLYILCFLVSVLLQFFYKYSLLHRYLLPLITITTFIFCSFTEEYLSTKLFRRICFVSLLGLLSGNLWVFPDRIAKGWDATLAHLPYYELRKKALIYLADKKISLKDISGGFPYNLSGKCINLNNDTTNFSLFPMEQSPFVLYSNVANEYTDEQLLSLKNKWIPIKTFGGWPIRFVLYKNPDYNRH